MNHFQYQVIFLGVILLLIIFFSLSNVDPVPYNSTLFSSALPYSEGMDGIAPSSVKKEKMTTEEEEETSINEPFKKLSAEGFQGLQTSPYGSEKPIDLFSQLEARKDCAPSPFSNSLGYLCLDDNAKRMLITRGGNQTSGGAQIGTPYTK